MVSRAVSHCRLLAFFHAALLLIEPTLSFDPFFVQRGLIRRLFQRKSPLNHPTGDRQQQLHRQIISWLSAIPENSDQRFPSKLQSPFEDERRPRRTSPSIDNTRYDYHVDPNDWGIETIFAPEPQFPNTMDALTDAAFEAIAGTLYNKQRLDPNIASNAMSRNIFGYRPVRAAADVGRIGIEIDGARHLLPHLSEGSAMRRVALVLAAKLSRGYWDGFEDRGNTTTTSRSVVIYFNTIKQSLMASQELQLLKRAELTRTGDKPTGKYDNVTILCLGQGSDIPEHMHRPKKAGRRRRSTAIGRGQVDPSRGILLVVQPTDFNDEFQPPGPSIGSVCSLQTLVGRATIHDLATVVLSPRFLSADDQVAAGWDQSGYQQSATFGGAEPPRGPTPWIMRDFTPPAFCWVANALQISPRLLRNDNSSGQQYSRIALLQSVMHKAHPWHIFAARSKAVDSNDFRYIASTKTSSGRPTKCLLHRFITAMDGTE